MGRPSDKQRAMKAIAWFADRFGLHAWSAELYWQDDPPDWAGSLADFVGASVSNLMYRTAKIWVSPARSKADDADPFSTLFHELCHVLAVEAGIKRHNGDRKEFVWNRLGDLCAEVWSKTKTQ